MGCCGYYIGVWERARVLTRTHESCDVGDVGEQNRTDRIGDFTELFKIDFTGIRRSTADDDLRLYDFRDIHNALIVDTAVKLYTV